MGRSLILPFCLLPLMSVAQYSKPIPIKDIPLQTTNNSHAIVDCAEDLLSVQTIPLETSIDIRWVTSPETNLKGFELQRSDDAVHFRSIGWIDSKGNSSEPTYYLFEDENVQTSGLYYYRLLIIGHDEKAFYSQASAAKLTPQGPLIFEAIQNPFSEMSCLKYVLSRPSLITIEILNPEGVKLKSYQQGLQDAGMYTLPWSGKQMGLSHGLYIANLWCDNTRYQLRLTEN